MTKPIEERLEDGVAIRMWMRSMQIDEEPECQDLRQRIHEFTKHGQPASGSFHVAKLNRKVVYMLSTKQDSKIALHK